LASSIRYIHKINRRARLVTRKTRHSQDSSLARFADIKIANLLKISSKPPDRRVSQNWTKDLPFLASVESRECRFIEIIMCSVHILRQRRTVAARIAVTRNESRRCCLAHQPVNFVTRSSVRHGKFIGSSVTFSQSEKSPALENESPLISIFDNKRVRAVKYARMQCYESPEESTSRASRSEL